eukprot:CAMPEP_0171804642 /NCGR_PEP_ID=MMETSP0991-20121206/74230_1 /TAXON_ID=483369 /ORGANISM="non described non described, Strain CCMP2098" /LENGTH=544 /DNA_ID=CAMNT_0012417049 /DNA_START=33 /DNA_END=1668 /DNA_ORIENTATION=-
MPGIEVQYTEVDDNLLRIAVAHIDKGLLEPSSIPDRELIADALKAIGGYQKHTLCPERILGLTFDRHQPEIEEIFSDSLRDLFTATRTHDQKAESSKIDLACISRVLTWLRGPGKRELRKARTLKSAFKAIEPLCRVSKQASPEYLGQMEADLCSILNEYRQEEMMQFSALDLSLDCQLSSVQEPEFVLLFNWNRQIRRGVTNILSSCNIGKEYYKIQVTTTKATVTVDRTKKSKNVAPSGPLAHFFAWPRSRDEQSLLELSKLASQVTQPIGFAKVDISLNLVGRVIGKRGSNINALRVTVERVVAAHLDKYLKGDDDSHGVGASQKLLVGVWAARGCLSHNNAPEAKHLSLEQLEGLASVISHSNELSTELATKLQESVRNANARGCMVVQRTCRLPHLCELSAYNHTADKQRARIKRFETARHKARELRKRGIIAALPRSRIGARKKTLLKSLEDKMGRGSCDHWARNRIECEDTNEGGESPLDSKRDKKAKGKEQYLTLKAAKKITRKEKVLLNLSPKKPSAKQWSGSNCALGIPCSEME